MNDQTTLGETIRDRRLALGYSLGQLATKVNKTASSIRAWERGQELPSDSEAAQLADALDLDAALMAALLTVPQVAESSGDEAVDVDDPWDGGDPDPDTESESVESLADSNDLQGEAPGPIEPAGGTATSGGTDELAELFEAKTEAVPVVPASGVTVAQPAADPILTATPARPVEDRSDNPVLAAWDDLRALYYKVFDPRRRWIYRVRFVLLLIAFYIMLRVLGWAGSNLLEAIGEVLDSISFSPGETPDVEA